MEALTVDDELKGQGRSGILFFYFPLSFVQSGSKIVHNQDH